MSNEPSLCLDYLFLRLICKISLFQKQLVIVVIMWLKSEKSLLRSFVGILCCSFYSPFYVWLLQIACFCILFQILFSVQCAVRMVIKGCMKDNSQILLVCILNNFDEIIYWLFYNRALVCMHAQQLWLYALDPQGIKSDRIPVWRGGVGHEGHSRWGDIGN